MNVEDSLQSNSVSFLRRKAVLTVANNFFPIIMFNFHLLCVFHGILDIFSKEIDVPSVFF